MLSTKRTTAISSQYLLTRNTYLLVCISRYRVDLEEGTHPSMAKWDGPALNVDPFKGTDRQYIGAPTTPHGYEDRGKRRHGSFRPKQDVVRQMTETCATFVQGMQALRGTLDHTNHALEDLAKTRGFHTVPRGGHMTRSMTRQMPDRHMHRSTRAATPKQAPFHRTDPALRALCIQTPDRAKARSRPATHHTARRTERTVRLEDYKATIHAKGVEPGK